MHLKFQVVNRSVSNSSRRSCDHGVRGNDLRHSIVVKLDDVVTSCARHEEPAGPDQETANQSDGWVALDVVLHEVLVVEQDQLLRLLVLQRVELWEVVAKNLNSVLHWEAPREVECLSLPRHGFGLLVLVVDVFIGAKRLIAVLFHLFGGFLCLSPLLVGALHVVPHVLRLPLSHLVFLLDLTDFFPQFCLFRSTFL